MNPVKKNILILLAFTFTLHLTSIVSAALPNGCVVANTKGCQGCECESKVCANDFYCCSAAWDNKCVSACKTLMPNYCTEPTPIPAPIPTPAPSASPIPIPSPVPPPPPPPPGCGNCGCEATVCTNDTYCCKVSWDHTCSVECKNLMPEYCAPSPPPTGCPSFFIF